MASAESDVRILLEAWSAAVRSRDIEAIMALYAVDNRVLRRRTPTPDRRVR
jgi:ketosteroid isomerase-like protein